MRGAGAGGRGRRAQAVVQRRRLIGVEAVPALLETPSGLPLVVHPGDLDGELEQQHQRDTQGEHRDRVLPRRRERREHEQPEDQPSPPARELGVGDDPDAVEHDHQQRQLEAHPEDDQQGDEQAEVVGAPQHRGLDVAADGEQELQGLGDDVVREHRPGAEQHHGHRDERVREALLLRVQARRDEAPELGEPDRARHQDPGRGGDLEAQGELLEHPERDEAALLPAPELHAVLRRQRAVGLGEDLPQRRQAERVGGVPEEPERGADRDGQQGDREASSQLVDVLDERHRAVGIGTTA